MTKAKEVKTDLPEGWAWTKIEEIAKLNFRDPGISSLPDDFIVSFLPMAAVDAEKGIIAKPEKRPLAQVRKGFTSFSENDVLFAKITPSMENGKAAIACDLINGRGFGSTEFHVISPKAGILSGWLFYFIRQEKFRRDAKANFAGTAGQLRVPADFIKNYPVPIAPLPEQHRIVARIEELFSRLDAGIEALQRAKAQLRRYRQAVLKAAVEGRLTEQWRKEHPEVEPAEKLLDKILKEKRINAGKNYKEPCIPNVNNLPRLPTGWVWASLEQLSKQIVDCLHSTPEFISEGKYCIDTTCIEPGRILFDKARFVSEKTYRARIQRLKPEADDIIFSREGTIGTAIKVPNNVEFCLGQRMMMFRPANGVISLYFMWAMLSNTFKKQWEPKVTGTTAPHVNIRDLKVMALPLASNDEQVKIIEEIERRLLVTDEVEKMIGQNLNRAIWSRQSILKRAFEGRLVPQDPGDEPASVLLERIRAEREVETGKRGKKNSSGCAKQTRITQ